MQGLADRSADFGRLEGGCDKTSRSSRCAPPCSGSFDGQGCKQGRLDGCLLPVTLPVTVGLGENAAGALNALVPVPASGGGRCPCARDPSIRTSQFPYSTVTTRSSPSRFARCSFRVRGYGRRLVLTIVHAIGGASSRGPQFTYGCSRYVCRLGYPLLIPSTKANASVLFWKLTKNSRTKVRRKNLRHSA